MSWFRPDPHDTSKGPDEICQNCGRSFHAHTNARCPDDDDDVDDPPVIMPSG